MTLNANPNAFMTSGENPKLSFELFKKWILDTFGKNKSVAITQALDLASLVKQKPTESIASYIGRCSKIFKGCSEEIPDKLQIMYAQRGLTSLNKIIAKIQAPKNLLELKNVCESHESCEVGPLPIHTIGQLDNNQKPLMKVVDNILKSKEEADKRLLESQIASVEMIASLNQLKEEVIKKREQEVIQRKIHAIHSVVEQVVRENNYLKNNQNYQGNNQFYQGKNQNYRNYQGNNQFYQGNNQNYRNYQGNNQNYQGNNPNGFGNFGRRRFQGNGNPQYQRMPQGGNNGNKPNMRCQYCGRIGHGWKICWARMVTERLERSENMVQGGNTGNSGNSDNSQEKTVSFSPDTKNQRDFLGVGSL
jgi:hypothetical protein